MSKGLPKENAEHVRSWFGTNLGEKGSNTIGKRDIESGVVGRYLGQKPSSDASITLDDTEEPAPLTKRAKRQGGGFGSFEGW